MELSLLFALFLGTLLLFSHTSSGEDLDINGGSNGKVLEQGDGCKYSEVSIRQTPSPNGKLPNGIPTFTVVILNQCSLGCRIHLHCGWFSSATLVSPLLLKRLAYDDCLINNGRPLPSGAALSFQYANSFSYPLSVSSLHCQ